MPSEPAKAASAAELYSAWVNGGGGSANLSDLSVLLESYYDVSAGDLEDFVLYMPAMSAAIEEVFVGRAKSGKVNDVKAACQARLDDLKADAELYPATAGNLESAQLEVVGDWVVFAVCANGSALVKTVKDAVN